MSDSITEADAVLDTCAASDPRVSEATVRRIDGDGAPVVLVGVVHDHPASVHRAAAVVEAVAPETVALELPALLVPTVAGAVRREGEEPADGDGEIDGVDAGGEMAAAIAATTGTVVGIDVPGRGTGRSLLAELRDAGLAPTTLLGVLGDLGRITAHTVAGRLALSRVPGFPAVDGIGEPHEYDLPADAAPTAQAEHERGHRRRGSALLRSLDPPPVTAFLDEVRERQMAERLTALSREGAVVAIVGYAHLDAVETMVENEAC